MQIFEAPEFGNCLLSPKRNPECIKRSSVVRFIESFNKIFGTTFTTIQEIQVFLAKETSSPAKSEVILDWNTIRGGACENCDFGEIKLE